MIPWDRNNNSSKKMLQMPARLGRRWKGMLGVGMGDKGIAGLRNENTELATLTSFGKNYMLMKVLMVPFYYFRAGSQSSRRRSRRQGTGYFWYPVYQLREIRFGSIQEVSHTRNQEPDRLC